MAFRVRDEEEVRMGKLDGKVVIVTGGGGGVASGMTIALAKEGADLSIVERDAERGEAVAREAEKIGHRVISIPCDVSKRDQVDAAVAETVERLGGVDVLVNNATGVSLATSNLPFMDHTEADFDRIFAVDVKGTFHFMQACFPHFKAQGGGKVINFSSGAGSERLAGFASYAAAKEGVRAMTGVAAKEWGQYGINVNVVCPAAMTPGMKGFLEDHPDPEFKKKALGNRPIMRLGDPEQDIGRVVAFLASAESDYMTGHTFWVDGGSSIHA
jgi:NAD(P)-dependent dehydrogenase (short-subunit alcohol dehydrogenase family)